MHSVRSTCRRLSLTCCMSSVCKRMPSRQATGKKRVAWSISSRIQGTNSFHGSAFEFLRNGAVNAKNYFASTVDQLKRNQFGGTIGGPILHDRLFFFGGYQGTITHTAPPTATSFVPTQRVLAGDFSTQTSTACGAAQNLIDPQTGKPFPNKQIPVSRYSPQALNVIKYIPVSNDPCGKIPL